MDKFARETATHAHRRIAETSRDLQARIRTIEQSLSRRAGFVSRCALCGDPCKPNRRYCHAHEWAEGTE